MGSEDRIQIYSRGVTAAIENFPKYFQFLNICVVELGRDSANGSYKGGILSFGEDNRLIAARKEFHISRTAVWHLPDGRVSAHLHLWGGSREVV